MITSVYPYTEAKLRIDNNAKGVYNVSTKQEGSYGTKTSQIPLSFMGQCKGEGGRNSVIDNYSAACRTLGQGRDRLEVVAVPKTTIAADASNICGYLITSTLREALND